MKKCKTCGHELSEKVRRCGICGTYQLWLWRWIIVLRHILEALTFPAAIIVAVLMYKSILQTKQQIEINQEFLTLTYKSLSIDSLRANMESRNQKKELDEYYLKQSPNISLKVNKVDIGDNDRVIIYYDVTNTGNSDADNIDMIFTLKAVGNDMDSASRIQHFKKIGAHNGKGGTWIVVTGDVDVDYTLRMSYNYRWTFVNKEVGGEIYYYFEYEKDKNKYRYPHELLDDAQIKQYWK